VHGQHGEKMGYLLFGDQFQKTLTSMVSAFSRRAGDSWQLNAGAGFLRYRTMRRISRIVSRCSTAAGDASGPPRTAPTRRPWRP